MADKTPIRGAYNGSSLTGLAEYATGDTVGVSFGGTGLATVGSNQLLTGNGTSALTSESNLTYDGTTLATTAFTATGNVSLDGGTFVFNESGADKDFRVEGDSEANLLMIDASTDRIGIGTATPSHLLDVEGVAHIATCVVTPKICISSQYVLPAADGSAGEILCTDGSGTIAFAEAASSGHTIANEGSVLASRTCLNFTGAGVTASDNSGTNATDVLVCATNALLGIRAADGTACTITLSNAAVGTCLQSDTAPKLGGNLDVNSNSIVSASNGNIAITPNGSGIAIIDGICYPTADGSAGQVLCTNGSAALQWATVNTDLCSDTSPQLGGNLDVNGNSIVSASNGNIPITPNGSGIVILDGICHPTADGSAGQVLCTNGSAALQWATVSAGVTLAGSTDNTIATVTGSNALCGEANLTFDGSTLAVTGALTTTGDYSSTSSETGFKCLTLKNTNTSTGADRGSVLKLGGSIDATGYNQGSIEFRYADTVVAQIVGMTDGGTSGTGRGGAFRFFTKLDNGSNTEALRINNEGVLGVKTVPASGWHTDHGVIQIGTGAFWVDPHDESAADNMVFLSNNLYRDSADEWRAIVTDEVSRYYQWGGGHYFDTASSTSAGGAVSFTNRLRICNDGSAQFCASYDSGHLFNIRNTSGSNPSGMQIYFAGTSSGDTTDYFGIFGDSGATRAIHYSNGDWVNVNNSYGSYSDVKLKQDIVDAPGYWNDFKALRYRKFRLKEEVAQDANAGTLIGLIAQEIEGAFSKLVEEAPDREMQITPVLDDEGNATSETTEEWVKLDSTTKSIKYSVLHGPVMATVVQELQMRLEAAEAKIAALEAA